MGPRRLPSIHSEVNMPPRICSSFVPSRGCRASIVVAGLGLGAGSGLALAQQAGGGSMLRRTESTAAVPRTGARATPPAGQAARGGNAGVKMAAATPGRAGPRGNAAVSTRARAPAAGVRQTSAVVSADGGVVLAGHAVATADCRQCGQRGCGKCRPVAVSISPATASASRGPARPIARCVRISSATTRPAGDRGLGRV